MEYSSSKTTLSHCSWPVPEHGNLTTVYCCCCLQILSAQPSAWVKSSGALLSFGNMRPSCQLGQIDTAIVPYTHNINMLSITIPSFRNPSLHFHTPNCNQKKLWRDAEYHHASFICSRSFIANGDVSFVGDWTPCIYGAYMVLRIGIKPT